MPECVLEFVNRKGFDFVRAKQLAICEMYTNDMVKYCTRTETIRNIAAYNSVAAQLAKENRKFQYNLIQSGARAKDYADSLFWLEKANIVIKVPKTNEGKMPLAGYEDLLSFKIYFNDVGLFSAKSDLAAAAILTQNYGGEVKGALTENYVAEELVANGIRPYYWESRGTAELDFVIQQQDKVVPIEAKANMNTKAKSLDTFRKKYNIEKSIRISAKNFGFENGIKSVPLYAVWCIR
jgi:predicted AAA+ superfamily ATPase